MSVWLAFGLGIFIECLATLISQESRSLSSPFTTSLIQFHEAFILCGGLAQPLQLLGVIPKRSNYFVQILVTIWGFLFFSVWYSVTIVLPHGNLLLS